MGSLPDGSRTRARNRLISGSRRVGVLPKRNSIRRRSIPRRIRLRPLRWPSAPQADRDRKQVARIPGIRWTASRAALSGQAGSRYSTRLSRSLRWVPHLLSERTGLPSYFTGK